MKKKCFLKSQSSLRRKAVAGGLAATFAFGTVGSRFAGATEDFQREVYNKKEENQKVIKEEVRKIIIKKRKCGRTIYRNY